jgi:hypothetical protein
MITAAIFRQAYPEFTDVAKYPDTMVDFWIGVAAVMLPAQTWGVGVVPVTLPLTALYDIGALNYVAHQVTVEARAVAAVAAGGDPGQASKGPITGESVGGVSRSYDAAATLLESGGDWNRTIYGVRFLQIARMVGSGPVEIGVSPACVATPWFGPWW